MLHVGYMEISFIVYGKLDQSVGCNHWSSSPPLGFDLIFLSLVLLLFRVEFAQSLSLLGLELGALNSILCLDTQAN